MNLRDFIVYTSHRWKALLSCFFNHISCCFFMKTNDSETATDNIRKRLDNIDIEANRFSINERSSGFAFTTTIETETVSQNQFKKRKRNVNDVDDRIKKIRRIELSKPKVKNWWPVYCTINGLDQNGALPDKDKRVTGRSLYSSIGVKHYDSISDWFNLYYMETSIGFYKPKPILIALEPTITYW